MTGQRSSSPSTRKYKWHHYCVSLLCFFALAAVVSSLFSTFNSIHNNINKKKKRELFRRSVENDSDIAVDDIDLNSPSMDNVMEINHSVSTPQQNMSQSETKNIDFMTKPIDTKNIVAPISVVSEDSNNNVTTAAVNEAEKEQIDEVENDFESAESDNDDDGSSNDQVDSVESNSTLSASPVQTAPNANITITGSGDNDSDDDDDDSDDDEDTVDNGNNNKQSNANSLRVPQNTVDSVDNAPQKTLNSEAVSINAQAINTANNSPQMNVIQPNTTVANATKTKVAPDAQPGNTAKLPSYAIKTYGVIGNPGSSKTKQVPVPTEHIQPKPNEGIENDTDTNLQPTPVKHLVPVHISDISPSASARNISSSLYTASGKLLNNHITPLATENVKASLKDGDGNDSKFEYPSFPTNYHATGIIILPNSKIAEPFEIWYAPQVKRSRIDYYYGNDKTYQFGDKGSFGVAYKYVPMYDDRKKNFDGCYMLTGTQNRRIIAQVITPNMTWFKYNKTEVYTGMMTTKWTYEYHAFGMKNFQSVWVTKNRPHRPIRYEMFGFDMMLGSYYDNYVINYVSFEEWAPNDKVFELPANMQCFNWSNSLEASLAVNPMQEFTAFSPDTAVDHHARYLEFKEKNYQDTPHPGDIDKRKHIYKHNARFINSHNRKNLSYKLQANMFTDKFDNELEIFHGGLEKDTRDHNGIKEFHKLGPDTTSHPIDKDIPESVDWRDFGAVTPVGGQGICGACYAFSAAEAVEAAWYRKTSKLVRLSKQMLVDCSWGFGNHGCKGGHYAAALSWIFVHGVSTQKSYGKYLGQEGSCHFNDTWFGANIEGFSYVPIWNATALKRTVAMHGPVAVSINTIPLSFKFYGKGIYSDPKCVKNRTTHSALVIGYGKEKGQEYWIVKNSWSSTWGERGYIRVAMQDDLCGITEYPVAVIVKHPSFQLPKKLPVNIEKDDDDGDDGDDGGEEDQPKIEAKNDSTNIPINPSGTTKVSRPMPGGIFADIHRGETTDDDQDDEDEQVDKQNKKITAAREQHKQHQKLIQHHQYKQGMFEETLSSNTIPLKGLHIEDINNDIKKIHMMLVNTVKSDKDDFSGKNAQIQGEQTANIKTDDIKVYRKPVQNTVNYGSHGNERKSSKSKSPKKLSNASKAKVSFPATPVHSTSMQNINKKGTKAKSKQKSKKVKSPKGQKEKSTKKLTEKEMKDQLAELISKLDHADLIQKHHKNDIKQSLAAKKAHIQSTVRVKKPLNPEHIGSLSHSKRSKTTQSVKNMKKVTHQQSVAGIKKSTISRIDSKRKRHKNAASKKRKSGKARKQNRKSKIHPSMHVTSREATYSPFRRTMDLNFLGRPSPSFTEAFRVMGNRMYYSKPKPTKRKNIPSRNSAKAHKRSKAFKKSDDAMEAAKQDSMDTLYSFIDRKVHDYTSHTNKKRDMNYYKHHIKNTHH